jgi:nucleoside-diphosphate-sugar epimerase
VRVLVTGGEGFIGRHIGAALRTAGHMVIAGVRRQSGSDSIECDFSRDILPETWIPRLTGIDVVINAVGILRESGANTFERVHISGPKALFEACQRLGVQRVIQISALGSPVAGEYLVSKLRGDVELAHLELDWTIIRPSLVYSIRGSYGGTSLLRAMAALPGLLLVPGSGEHLMQPIRAEDLALVVVGLIDKKAGIREVISAVGPAPVSLLRYLLETRRWLGLPAPLVVRIPEVIARFGAWLGEHVSNGPVGITMWRMLNLGNIATDQSTREMVSISGVSPLSLKEALDFGPSFVQDRWHARLYFLGPVLRVTLAVLWLCSAAVGFLTPTTSSRELFASAGLPPIVAAPLVFGASTVDLVLGILALIAWRPAVVAGLMCASLFVYTVFIGVVFPSLWLEPFGGLLKNLPLIPAVLVMGVLSRRR